MSFLREGSLSLVGLKAETLRKSEFIKFSFELKWCGICAANTDLPFTSIDLGKLIK